MSSLARQQLYFSRFFTVDEIADEVSAVTAEEIQQLAQKLLDPAKLALTLLGPLNGLKLDRSKLAC
jgi:predicted Zn-dependent peptidase